jgi:hypothetical protein
MSDITIGITLAGCEVHAPESIGKPLYGMLCIYFPKPGIFLHGTVEDFASFINQIQGKLEKLLDIPQPQPESQPMEIGPLDIVSLQSTGKLEEWDDDGPPIEWSGLEEMLEVEIAS